MIALQFVESKWPEISEGLLEPGQKTTDRADIIVRIYHMKLEDLLYDIKHGHAFDACHAGIKFYSSSKVLYLLLTAQ